MKHSLGQPSAGPLRAMVEKKRQADGATDTESRLLDAALEVFAEKGLHGASTQEIAQRAGVKKPTLHYYFRHKETLYETVFQRAFMKMSEDFGPRLQGDLNFEEVLRRFIAHHVRAYAEHPATVRLWMHENLIGAPVAVPVLLNNHRDPESPYRRLMDSMQEAMNRGEIRQVDPGQTFISIMGASLFFHISQSCLVPTVPSLVGTPDDTIDVNTFLAAREEAVFELIYRGLRH